MEDFFLFPFSLLSFPLLQAIRLHNVKQQLLTADNVDLRRILSIADKPIDEANILASPGLWEYKQTLTLPRVQNHLAPMPSKVRDKNGAQFIRTSDFGCHGHQARQLSHVIVSFLIKIFITKYLAW